MYNNSSDENSNEIDDIVQELKDSCAPKSNATRDSITIPKVDDENVGDYIYQKSAEMIEISINAIKSMQNLIQTAADPKEITAYSSLISTALKGIDNLNKIYLQQKQAKTNIELKKIELQKKPSLIPPNPNGSQTNNIFIGSRDDVMSILNNKESKKVELLDNKIIEE